MRKIRETITALMDLDNMRIVRVRRKEGPALPNERVDAALGFVLKISAMASVTMIVLFAEFWKLIAILVFVTILFLICYGTKD